MFKSKSGYLLNFLKYLLTLLCNITIYEHSNINYDTVMNRCV